MKLYSFPVRYQGKKIRFAKINWNKGDNSNWLSTSGRLDPSVVLNNNNQLQTGFTSVRREKKTSPLRYMVSQY